jgi:hypothetical protein
MLPASMFTRFRTPSPDGRYVAYVQPSNGRAPSAPQLFLSRKEGNTRWGASRLVPAGAWPVSWSLSSEFIAYPKYGGVDLYWPASGMQRRIYEPSTGDPLITAVAVSSSGSMLVLKGSYNWPNTVWFWALPISGGTPRMVLQEVPDADKQLAPLLAWGGQSRDVLEMAGVGQAVDFAVVNDRLYFTQPERRSRAWVAPIPR